MNEHIVKRFEDELNELKDKVLAMGGLVEKAIRRSMRSLVEYDQKRARKVIERDKAINALEVEIDEMTRSLLALRQPAAGDLRFVITTIKIVTDLERIGDLAEGIAEYTIQSSEHPITRIGSLETIADLVTKQTTDALDAFARADIDLALAVIANDKKVNRHYKGMQRENITYMLEDPRQISSGIAIQGVAKNLERMGDHAATIAEMVIYMVKGHDVRHVDHKTAAAIVGGHIADDDDD